MLVHILDTAASFIGVTEREVKKVPLLRGKSIFNLFFEPSTRTRTTFEIAAKRLSAGRDQPEHRRLVFSKARTLLDTVDNLSAMYADMFVVRHSSSGAAHLIASHVAPHVHVINAGDGRHAHPTQGLLDIYTIRHYKKDFAGCRLRSSATCCTHASRARSSTPLTTLGVPDVRVIDRAPCFPRVWSTGRVGASRHARGAGGLRRGDDAAAAERAHERPLLPRRRNSSSPTDSRRRSSRSRNPTRSSCTRGR